MWPVVHVTKDNFDIYIGRGGPYGNSWSHKGGSAEFRVKSRTEAILEHEKWLLSQPELIKKIRTELRGKILGCYCAPLLKCHGDTLARIANDWQLAFPLLMD